MKTLLLMRHAKSSWDNARLSDYERPLNERGRRDAPRMGELLRREGLIPDLIAASSAKRAATTAELVALELSLSSDIRYTEKLYLATIDQLPLPDASVDCVISNCVINLATDKPAVFREIARVLKPGGRLAVSDIALKKPLPPGLSDDLMAYVGCIAGAIFVEDYRQGLLDAGFAEVQVVDTGSDLNAYAQVENSSGCCSSGGSSLPIAEPVSCCSPPSADRTLHRGLTDLLGKYNVNDYAASVRVYAVKP